MTARTRARLGAACGGLYVILLVGGDDVINPAGEVPGPTSSLREITSYVARADTPAYWWGRSIGLLGLCALLVFVAHVSRRIKAAENGTGTLSAVALAAGVVAVVLQLMAAPAQFAAVQAGNQIDPHVTRALLLLNGSFALSFLPLAVFLGSVAAAGILHRVLPLWLAWSAAVLAIGLVGGMIGQPHDPAVVSYMAFAIGLLWFVAASIALMRSDPTALPRHDRPEADA